MTIDYCAACAAAEEIAILVISNTMLANTITEVF